MIRVVVDMTRVYKRPPFHCYIMYTCTGTVYASFGMFETTTVRVNDPQHNSTGEHEDRGADMLTRARIKRTCLSLAVTLLYNENNFNF